MKYKDIKAGMLLKIQFPRITNYVYVISRNKKILSIIELDCREDYTVYREKILDDNIYFFEDYKEVVETKDETTSLIERLFGPDLIK